MNLLDRYECLRQIAGIDYTEFENVIGLGCSTNLRVTNLLAEGFMLSNNTAVRCVRFYYEMENSQAATKVKRCIATKKQIGRPPASAFDCVICHRFCYDRFRSGALKRKKSLQSILKP